MEQQKVLATVRIGWKAVGKADNFTRATKEQAQADLPGAEVVEVLRDVVGYRGHIAPCHAQVTLWEGPVRLTQEEAAADICSARVGMSMIWPMVLPVYQKEA